MTLLFSCRLPIERMKEEKKRSFPVKQSLDLKCMQQQICMENRLFLGRSNNLKCNGISNECYNWNAFFVAYGSNKDSKEQKKICCFEVSKETLMWHTHTHTHFVHVCFDILYYKTKLNIWLDVHKNAHVFCIQTEMKH